MKRIIFSGFLTGIVILFIGFGINAFVSVFFPSLYAEYLNPALFRPWSDPRMQLMFLHPFILCFVLAYIWNNLKSVFPGKTSFNRAINLSLIYFIVTGIPGMLITYASFQVSLAMVILWSISSFIQIVISCIILSKLNK